MAKNEVRLKELIILLWKRSMEQMQRGPEIGKRLKCVTGNDPICDAFHNDGCADCPFGVDESGPGCLDFYLSNVFGKIEPMHAKDGVLVSMTPRLEKIMEAYYEFYRDGLLILKSTPPDNFVKKVKPRLLELDRKIAARHKLEELKK